MNEEAAIDPDVYSGETNPGIGRTSRDSPHRSGIDTVPPSGEYVTGRSCD